MAYVGTPIDTTNQFQSLVGKRFSGDASTTAFTLDVAPSSTLDIEVFVENVRQDPNSAYSLSGTTLTFAAAPPSGTNNIYVVHQAKAVGTISPAAGTVNADSFDNTVISGHTALATRPAATDEFLVSDAGTIKRVDYSLVNNGIIEADQFVITSSLAVTSEVTISSNLTRNANSGFSQIGTGMSHSSGLFSFPSTGMYYISAVGDWYSSNTPNYCGLYISMTTDNGSNYSTANTNANITSGNHYANSKVQALFNCTNTSTHKVRFRATAGASTNLQGSSTAILTNFLFMRLGDSQ